MPIGTTGDQLLLFQQFRGRRLVIGVISAIGTLLGNDPAKKTAAVVILLFFFGLAGVFSILKRQEKSVSSHASDAALLAVGRGDVVLLSGCFGLLIAMLFGIIIAPINLYRYYTSFRSNQETIERYEQLLAGLS